MNAVIERMSTPPPQNINLGQYQLLRLLKDGGMAKVYLAYDTHTDQHVAIKIAERGRFDEEQFVSEVRTMRKLNHPHILPLLDARRNRHWNYIVMPYMTDGTLHEYINQEILTMEEVSFIFEQLADALQYMHSCGITHRDVKPSNILLNGDIMYLADFGIAVAQEEEVVYFDEPIMGTPTYMAPEIYEGEIRTQGDIYSLGIILYQMMTGCVPFEGENVASIYWKQKTQRPLPPSLLNSCITPAMERVILRALEREPQDRFQTVEEFALAYRKALTPSLLKRLTTRMIRTLRHRI